MFHNFFLHCIKIRNQTNSHTLLIYLLIFVLKQNKKQVLETSRAILIKNKYQKHLFFLLKIK